MRLPPTSRRNRKCWSFREASRGGERRPLTMFPSLG
jgi:hypothetical protein